MTLPPVPLFSVTSRYPLESHRAMRVSVPYSESPNVSTMSEIVSPQIQISTSTGSGRCAMSVRNMEQMTLPKWST